MVGVQKNKKGFEIKKKQEDFGINIIKKNKENYIFFKSIFYRKLFSEHLIVGGDLLCVLIHSASLTSDASINAGTF